MPRFRPLRFQTLADRAMMAGDGFVPDDAIYVDSPSTSPAEQWMLDRVNDWRQSPHTWSNQYGVALNRGLPANTISATPKPPLAAQPTLVTVARNHSVDMLQRNFFDHTNPDGVTADGRVQAAGLDIAVGENLGVQSIHFGGVSDASTQAAMSEIMLGLFESSGHRRNLFDIYEAAGVGIDVGDYRFPTGHELLSVMATQVFAFTDPERSIPGRAVAVGTASHDQNNNGLLDVGEGRAGIQVLALASNGTAYTTTTTAGGGFALPLPAGRYTITAADASGELTTTLGTVDVASQNVRLDVDVTQLSETPRLPLQLRKYDISGDERITSLDALRIINFLNEGTGTHPASMDVSGDGQVGALDALQIINYLNDADSIVVALQPEPTMGTIEPDDERWLHDAFFASLDTNDLV